MVHLGPPGACRLVVPLPLPGRIPDETGGSEGPSGSVPTSGTSGTWKLVPGLGITRYVYRYHGTVTETDVRLHRIPARRGNAQGRTGAAAPGAAFTAPSLLRARAGHACGCRRGPRRRGAVRRRRGPPPASGTPPPRRSREVPR